MRIMNLFLTVALLCCDYPKRTWRQTGDHGNQLHVSNAIFVSGTANQGPVLSTNGSQSVPYCPHYGNFCLKRYTEKLASKYNGMGPACCEQCNSEPSTMRCCSDIMPCEDDVTNAQGQDRVCIRTVSNLYHDIGVLAVATCPEKSADGHHSKCVQRYTTVTRHNPTGGLYNVGTNDVMPVRDVTTGTLYRNVYCALCNGVDLTNIKFWELSVGCHYTSNLNLSTDSNILNSISGTDNCYFVFKDPDTAITSETCSFAVAKCYVTEVLTFGPFKHDPMVPQMCLTDEKNAMISRRDYVLYNNIHCLRCNQKFSYWEPHIPLDNPSFSVVLRIKNIENMSSSHPSSCGGGMVFHLSKRQCVEARCSLLRQLRGNVCERTIPNPDSFAYRIGFRVVPQDRFEHTRQPRISLNVTVDTGYQIIPELGKQIKKLLLSVFPSIQWIVYEMVLVAGRNYTETFNISEPLEANLAYYEVRLKLVFPESHDPEEKLIKLVGLEDKVTLDIMHDQHNMSFIFMMLDDVLHFKLMRVPYKNCSLTFDRFFPCPKSIFFDPLIKTYPLEMLTAVPVSGCNYHNTRELFFKTPVSTERNILELRKCPFVKETRSKLNWVDTDTGIEFRINKTAPGINASGESSDSQRIHLKASEYIYEYASSDKQRIFYLKPYEYLNEGNSDVIWMCLETHEKLFSSRPASFADCRRADRVLSTLMASLVVVCLTL